MKNIFLIFGYGVPKDIFRDEHYNFYLKMVFNRMYDLSVVKKIKNPLILFTGGKTDCIVKPYRRSEAGEMVKFMMMLMKRSFVRKATSGWTLALEPKAISTLENFLFSKEIFRKRRINKANVFLFCERSRERRIKILAKKILGKNYRIQVTPIDFDISPNRYLAPEFLAKKENIALKSSFWALKSERNLQYHHKIFQEKLDYLRTVNPENQAEAIKKWWKERVKEAEEKQGITF